MLFQSKFDIIELPSNETIPSVCKLRRCMEYHETEFLNSMITALDFDIRYLFS